jgi:peroxiredoxin Q/BCP
MEQKRLEPNTTAPDFATVDEKGDPVALSDFQGRNLVLYFYPKNGIHDCTSQACSLRDSFASLEAENATVLGVSLDSGESHSKFKEEHDLPFSLLVDADSSLCKSYGVLREFKALGKSLRWIRRSLFVIDGDGKLVSVNYGISSKDSVPVALKALQEVA